MDRHNRNKKLRSIKVRYSFKHPAPKFPYKSDFNLPQFSSIDEVIDLMKSKLSVEVSKAVVIRSAVAEYTSWIKTILQDSDTPKQDRLSLLRQLEAASQDR